LGATSSDRAYFGTGAGATDSFFLDRVLARGTKDPKVFVDKVRRFGHHVNANAKRRL